MFKTLIKGTIVAGMMVSGAAMALQERVTMGNLVMENIPDIPMEVTERLRQYQNTRSASFSSWVPDGSLLINTRFGQVSQVHHVAEPLGARNQVTFFNEPVSGAEYAPKKSGLNGFVYQRDVGGAEDYQLFFHDMTSGKSHMITDGTFRNSSATWSKDGSMIAFASNRRDGKHWDVYGADPTKSGSFKLLFQSPEGSTGYWNPISFNYDGSKLLVVNAVGSAKVYLHVVDVATGTSTPVDMGDGPGSSFGTFAAKQNILYVRSNVGTDFTKLYSYDIATGQKTLLSGDINWDVAGVSVSKDGRFYAFTTNEDGLSKLHLRTTGDNGKVEGPDLPAGIISTPEFDDNGAKIAFSLNRATSPTDVYVFDLASLQTIRWTKSEVGGLDTDNFPEPSLVRYKSFDGLEVPAFVLKPKSEGPHPVIIRIHGGPEGQARPSFSSTYQYWANELGVAVIQPNVRGSTGYGKSYHLMDNGFKREDSVKDIGTLLDWIATQPDLDENNVMLYGGSYGGYMVLAGMVHYADRLKGAIDVVGISNFVTFLENTRSYRRDHRRNEYGDERDPAMREHLMNISPNMHVDKMTKPMFIIQGYNDPRVPYTESEQMLAALKANGIPTWFLMAMDEGHGFRKKGNRDFQAAAMSMFITDLLK